MAGSPPPVEEAPKLGTKATIAALMFVVTILAGFGAATAASYEGDAGYDDHGDEYGDDHSDDDEDHAEDDDHADDEDHS